MRKHSCYIVFCVMLASCNTVVQKPEWINKKELNIYQNLNLSFKTSSQNWTATLLTFTQPIPLNCTQNKEQLIVSANTLNGITEGPAKLCLSNGKQQFYYEFTLQNKDNVPITLKDYRSPKTVNPDSSLQHQRMVHSIDQYRNIVEILGYKNYFFEEEIALSPKTVVIQAIPNQPLTAFYVQPGSVVNISLTYKYIESIKSYAVTAGPLKDKYNNLVADGTKLTFIYNDAAQTYSREVSLLKGYASTNILATNSYTLQAKVNDTNSATINLNKE